MPAHLILPHSRSLKVEKDECKLNMVSSTPSPVLCGSREGMEGSCGKGNYGLTGSPHPACHERLPVSHVTKPDPIWLWCGPCTPTVPSMRGQQAEKTQYIYCIRPLQPHLPPPGWMVLATCYLLDQILLKTAHPEPADRSRMLLRSAKEPCCSQTPQPA